MHAHAGAWLVGHAELCTVWPLILRSVMKVVVARAVSGLASRWQVFLYVYSAWSRHLLEILPQLQITLLSRDVLKRINHRCFVGKQCDGPSRYCQIFGEMIGRCAS
eukprot:3550087-Prymnesium_polylepis.1